MTIYYGYSDAHFNKRWGISVIHLIVPEDDKQVRRGMNSPSLCGTWISWGAQGKYIPRQTQRVCKKCERALAKVSA